MNEKLTRPGHTYLQRDGATNEECDESRHCLRYDIGVLHGFWNALAHLLSLWCIFDLDNRHETTECYWKLLFRWPWIVCLFNWTCVDSVRWNGWTDGVKWFETSNKGTWRYVLLSYANLAESCMKVLDVYRQHYFSDKTSSRTLTNCLISSSAFC